MKKKPAHNIFVILQWAAAAVFAGRAYQHLFWDGPYRELFWDPRYIQWVVEKFFSISWEEYVTHPEGDLWFQWFVVAQGVFYMVCALVVIFIKKLPRWFRWILVAGAIDLVFLALVYMKDKFYHFGQFFEYSLQFGAPVFLFYYLKIQKLTDGLVWWMKAATALTFASHGLYAIGYYPRPATFMTMVHNIFGLEAAGINLFLNLAGLFDFVFAVGLLFLRGRMERAFLWYAVGWGALTSMARIFGNFYADFPLESLHQWVYEAVCRFPHFLIPLALVLRCTGSNGTGTTAQ